MALKTTVTMDTKTRIVTKHMWVDSRGAMTPKKLRKLQKQAQGLADLGYEFKNEALAKLWNIRQIKPSMRQKLV